MKQKSPQEHFAILIPARDESKVIEKLLESIEHQTQYIDMKDVYVVIETKEDPTYSIARRHGATVFIRKHLELQRKGYALDEVVKEILKQKKHYDAYFIFDADNVADSHFLEEMTKSYREGYDIVIGYRNCKNGNDNIISAASCLSFSFLNLLGNKRRVKEGKSVLISGTGFFIRGEVLEAWKGFPFHSLTEDYELSIYLCLHRLSSFYNENAIFYDEHPTSYHTTVLQRTRWIRGFFDSRKEYLPEIKAIPKEKRTKSQKAACIGVIPYVILLMLAGILLLTSIAFFFYHIVEGSSVVSDLTLAATVLLFVYIVLQVLTAIVLIVDKKLNLSWSMKLKSFFFNPLFLLSYLWCLLRAFTLKEVTWQKIDHSRNE